MALGLTDEFGNELIPDIALPNEIPPLPNLNDLPPQVLHSGTVETLLGQNEDLFARLKVSFKTNAELERKLMIAEQSELEIKHINSSLLAQIQIHQEKDKALKAKHEELEWKIQLLNEALEQEKQNTVNTRLLLEEKSQAYETLRSKLSEASTHIGDQELAIRNLEAGLKAEFETLLQKNESANRFQTSALEEKLAAALSENEGLRKELGDFKEKTERLKNVSEKCAEAENKLIYFERRSQELENRYNKDFSDLQSQITIYRTEAKSLSLQLHTTEQRLDEKLAENVRLKETVTESRDQFESLQTLWAEGQKRLEESRLKYDSLQKINQELSRKLKEQRTQSSSEAAESAPIETLPDGKEEKFERLESLLAGIQAGFPKSIGIIENDKGTNEAAQ